MLKPRALKPGDRIAVVAPASPFKRDEFDDGLAALRQLGLIPVYDDSVFARSPNGYVAGSPEIRAAAIHQAWRDPSIAGVIAVRGGYGSAQVLPLLDASAARAACKPFIGYSDLTAILTFLTIQNDLVAFHGPMLTGRLGRGAAGYDRDSFERVLFRAEPAGEVAPPSLEALRPGECRGTLLGGTITQLLASLGTPFAFDPPPGYVLFFEEVNERPYRLDRMITQLQQSGLLARAAGVIVGDLDGCDEPHGGRTARSVIAELFADFPGPVVAGFPSGHTLRPAITLPFGVACRLVSGPRPSVIIEEAAVQ